MSEPGDSSPSPMPADTPAEPEPPPRLAIAVVREDGDWHAFDPVEDCVHEAAAALAECLALPPGSEASVVLGSDALVQRLNKAYRGKDAATNVLSFPFQKPAAVAPGSEDYLGDVILAAETVAREAASRRSRRVITSSISSCMACCTFSAATIRPTQKPRRWSDWRPRSWKRSALPILMQPQPLPDRSPLQATLVTA
jgi:hypothetical protein